MEKELEEKLKKLKTRIKKTRTTVQSFVTGQDMTSRIKDLDLNLVEETDGRKYFHILVKEVEVCHETHKVNHSFDICPYYSYAEIKNCEYLKDGDYSYNELRVINSENMFRSQFRECMWNIAKVMEKISISDYY